MYVVGTQKNQLPEMVLTSIQNKWFSSDMRGMILNYTLLYGVMF